MTGRLEHAAFFGNLNSTFRLQVEGSDWVDVELVEVSELNTTPRQEIFSIVFRCRSSVIFPQRIYRLEHDKMGQFDLFLVPIRKDNQSVDYEAVFNRLTKEAEP
jgi:hypothetical protein